MLYLLIIFDLIQRDEKYQENDNKQQQYKISEQIPKFLFE